MTSRCAHGAPMCADCWVARELDKFPARVDPQTSQRVRELLAGTREDAA